ncbi:MAG: 2-oxoacid:acceptor oxidoreductase family protein [Deltaproteobacteria bacterium]|nr:MAG: 2-oxoacid:acceptor oxidoreductase family protein [Deltaproteobacteria bacterium]
MASLLNPHRPPVFCPGCSHDRSVRGLDRALQEMGLKADEVVIVSDIGCSGLFDTFFQTHAFHGLHGRALTYAAGIKLSRPDLKVIVTMGDGGLGIGGAHLLAACRRNLDLTLLVLNNFNFGMTGGQFSCTTPEQSSVASGFLNALERPMDLCTVAASAGAPFVTRASVYQKDLSRLIVEAVSFDGFSVVDLWSICPARYLKRNPISPKDIERAMAKLPVFHGPVATNARNEYGRNYRQKSGRQTVDPDWKGVDKLYEPPVKERRELVLLGSAGERVITAGHLLAGAAVLAGMRVTQKNDYNITVMRGPSVTELIISPGPITYTGVEQPDVVIGLSQEGVNRGRDLFERMTSWGRVFSTMGVEIPATSAQILEVDLKAARIKKKERALAMLSILARTGDPLTGQMLTRALEQTFHGKRLTEALDVLQRAATLPGFQEKP